MQTHVHFALRRDDNKNAIVVLSEAFVSLVVDERQTNQNYVVKISPERVTQLGNQITLRFPGVRRANDHCLERYSAWVHRLELDALQLPI